VSAVRSSPFLIALSGVCVLFAQDVPPTPTPVQEPGSVDGVVRSNGTGEILRRAQVVLKPAGSNEGARYQTTGDDGKFSFPSVLPGRYSITVDRDGFLRLAAARLGNYKMPPVFSVRPGESVSGLDFRMIPAGVISGKVKFDDAEPAMNVAVAVYHGYYDRGRHAYAAVANGFTNDRGEYRLTGLAAGTYYVAALYRGPARPQDAVEEQRTDPNGTRFKTLSYTTTFFPQTQKMADAVAVGVQPGQEISAIDIYLTPVHTVRVRGRVVSALSGQTVQAPGLSLRWNDPGNTGSVTAPADITFDRDQNFEIRGIPPGQYWLLAGGSENGHALTARVPLTIGEDDISGVDIVLGQEIAWPGKIQIDGDNPPPLNGFALSFEPRRATASPVRAQVSENGEFTAPLWPNETYDVYLANAPEDVYLKSVRLANTERVATGVECQPGETPAPIDLVVSTSGGQVVGQAVTSDPTVVASGAVIVLIPDPLDGRMQAYKSTYADETGNFLFRGVAPGRYVLVAWMDQPPCDPYNPGDIDACRAHGVPTTIPEGGAQSVQVVVN
jgi:Carboxypeptidase regulatory-like domain